MLDKEDKEEFTEIRQRKEMIRMEESVLGCWTRKIRRNLLKLDKENR